MRTRTGSRRREVNNVLDGNIVVSEFELQPRYILHFRTNIFGNGMKRPNTHNCELVCTNQVQSHEILPIENFTN